MKRVDTWALDASILGTLWVATVIVAYFIAGAAMDSGWFWACGVIAALILVIAPFMIYDTAEAANRVREGGVES